MSKMKTAEEVRIVDAEMVRGIVSVMDRHPSVFGKAEREVVMSTISGPEPNYVMFSFYLGMCHVPGDIAKFLDILSFVHEIFYHDRDCKKAFQA
jgi:hypothetical protein